VLPVELNFKIGDRTGWGVLGLHLALGLAREGWEVHASSVDELRLPAAMITSVRMIRGRSDARARRIRLEVIGNHFPGPQLTRNRFTVGLAVFEDTHFEPAAVERLRRYDLLVAFSFWGANQLKLQGLSSVVWHQGFDDTLFDTRERRRIDDRFLIFSGGKLEFRKGQDIVLDAFRKFRATPEGRHSVLVTSWQNPWPQYTLGIDAAGYVRSAPSSWRSPSDMYRWLRENGVPNSAVIALGSLSQSELADTMRECDVGVFASRCEGATNMVLAEAMGCGIPCIATEATGQADLPIAIPVKPLPLAVPECSLYRSTEGWAETDPDSLVKALSAVRVHGAVGDRTNEFRAAFRWRERAKAFSRILLENVPMS
jgi:glycosyltransferase involved in cell wall biosynthesis